MADAFIVGRTLGVNALAAVGCGFGLMSFIFGFSFGLTNGFAVITAQRVGAADEEGIRKSVATSLSLCAAFSVLFTLVLSPLAGPLLTLMATPQEILADAVGYITIILWGMTATLLYNMLANILRAAGDSLTPLFFLILSSLVNIGLDYLCILVLGWGIRGAAAATVFSQILSTLLCAGLVRKRFPRLLPRREHWAPRRREIGVHLALGVSMGLQQSVVEVGNMLVQTAINGLGTVTIAAVSTAQRIRNLNLEPLFCLSRAVTTYTAQNYGAGKIPRIYRGMFRACLLSLGASLLMLLLNLFLGAHFAALFLKDNPEAVAMAHRYLLYIGFTLFLLGVMLIFRSALQGLGKNIAPILCGVAETLMSILAAFWLIPRLGFTGICLVNPLSWFASGIPLYIAFWSVSRRLRAQDRI
jgi:putative MATE family efflux protein